MIAAGKIERLWINAQEKVLCQMDRLIAPVSARHLEVGLRGERAALFELRRRGYVVVAQRWISPKVPGDVDLIAWHGDKSNQTLCFIEVKSRTARDMTPAASAVDDDKRQMLRRLAAIYLHHFPESERRTIPVRFDVVSVYLLGNSTEFEIFAGAFGWR
jgi:putative endonuclease